MDDVRSMSRRALLFGRALTAMTYNNQSILVVAANNVVYAYYKTLLYGDTRQK